MPQTDCDHLHSIFAAALQKQMWLLQLQSNITKSL